MKTQERAWRMFCRMLLVVWILLLPGCVSIATGSGNNLMKKGEMYLFPNSMKIETVGGYLGASFYLRVDPVSNGVFYSFTFPILNYEHNGKGFVCPAGQRPTFMAMSEDGRDRTADTYLFLPVEGESNRKKVYFNFFNGIREGTLASMYARCVALPN